jgi:hypothetical protein
LTAVIAYLHLCGVPLAELAAALLVALMMLALPPALIGVSVWVVHRSRQEVLSNENTEGDGGQG